MSLYASEIPLSLTSLSFNDSVFGRGIFNPTPPAVNVSLAWRDADIADGWPEAMANAAHGKRGKTKLVLVGPKGVGIGYTPHPADVSPDPLLCTWTRLIGGSVTLGSWARFNWWSLRNDGILGWSAFAPLNGPSIRSRRARLEYFFTQCGVPRVDWSKLLSIDEISITGSPHGIEKELEVVESPAGECWLYLRSSIYVVTRYKFMREGQFRGACSIVIDESLRTSTLGNCPMDVPVKIMHAIVDPIMKAYLIATGVDSTSVVSGVTAVADTDTPMLSTHPQRVAGAGGFQKDGIVLLSGYVYGWPDMCNCAVVRGDVVIATPDTKPVVSIINVVDREVRWPGSLLKTISDATVYEGKPVVTAADLASIADAEICTRYFPREYTTGSNLWQSTNLYSIVDKAGEDTDSTVMVDQQGENPPITFAAAALKAQNKRYTMMSVIKRCLVPNAVPAVIRMSGDAKVGYTFSYMAVDSTAYVTYSSPLDVYADYLNGAGIYNASTDSRDVVAEIKLQAGAALADDKEWDDTKYTDKYEFDERAMWSVARSFEDMPANVKAAQQIVQFFQDRKAFAQMSYACIASGKAMLSRMGLS